MLKSLAYLGGMLALAALLILLPAAASRILFAVIILGAVGGSLYFYRDEFQDLHQRYPQVPWWIGWVLLIAGSVILRGSFVGGLLLIGLGLLGLMPYFSFSKFTPADGDYTPFKIHWGWVILGSAGLAGLTLLTVHDMRERTVTLHYHVQILILVLSLGAMLAAGRSQDTVLGQRTGGSPAARFASLRPVLLAVLLFGFALRLIAVDTTIKVFVDEVLFSSAVLPFRENVVRVLEPVYIFTNFPRVFAYFQWESVQVFGRDFLGLRFPSVMVGTLTLAATYLLGRALLNRTTALTATLLLAAFPPYIHFSRLALINIVDPLFGVLALACCALGFRHRRSHFFWIGGVMLGLTHYFYDGGRLFFTPLVILWLGLGVLLWKLPIRTLFLVLMPAAIIAIPFYIVQADKGLTLEHMELVTSRDSLFERFSSGEKRTEYLREYLQEGGELLLSRPDDSNYYLGPEPLLLIYMVPFFFIGLALTLRRDPTILFPLWAGSAIFGNSLLTNADHPTRYILLMPGLCLLMAVGLRWTLQQIPRARHPLALPAAALLFSGIGIVYYFTVHLDGFNRETPTQNITDAMLRSRDFPTGTEIIMLDGKEGQYHQHMLEFIADDINLHMVVSQNFNQRYVNRLPRDRSYAFFLLAHHTEALELLHQNFILEPPRYTANRYVPADEAYILYFVSP
jgi:4-amino-4-deoxy-L-arabinose transferase-like glycosyltransferase